MSNFWSLSNGEKPNGSAESSHVSDFSVIPDGTTAHAAIKDFVLVETSHAGTPLYEVTYRITEGDYKNREVRQKIKCFDPKPNIADRALNMLKRMYDLCSHKQSHTDAPNTQDLKPMVGKVLGIKISEFIGVKQDGTPSNGNYISEVHAADKDFQVANGTKLEVYISPVDSALSRNAGADYIPKDDIPF
jgi:hypothetical protein